MSRVNRFPILYKTSSTTQKTLFWEIWTEDNIIYSKSGQVGGRARTSRTAVLSGKNIGTKAETTPKSQAYKQARALHVKKMEIGYLPEGSQEAVLKCPGFPMLAHTFEPKKYILPERILISPKLDGIRGIWNDSMYSRQGKPLTAITHLDTSLRALQKHIEMETRKKVKFFDGELYCHTRHDDFESIVSACKKKDPSPESAKMPYHIYDICFYGDDVPMYVRARLLKEAQELAENRDWDLLHFVVPDEVSPANIPHYTTDCIQLGYEGSMIRIPDGPYEEDRRSYTLLKHKVWKTDEFRIVGHAEGKGRLEGAVGAFICEINDSHGQRTFECVLGGKDVTEFLFECAKDPSLYKHKWLEVEYLKLTGKNRLPKHATGKRIRDNF